MRRKPPSIQPLALGPSRPRMELGDRLTLDNGLVLTLICCEDMTPVFRANPAGYIWHQVWTNHMNRPGLYIRVGDWPRGPKAVFDADELLERARTAQILAETFFDLDEWAPVDHDRAVSPAEVA